MKSLSALIETDVYPATGYKPTACGNLCAFNTQDGSCKLFGKLKKDYEEGYVFYLRDSSCLSLGEEER